MKVKNQKDFTYVWECSCGKINPIREMECEACGLIMPQKVRDTIFKEELDLRKSRLRAQNRAKARKRGHVIVSAILEHFAISRGIPLIASIISLALFLISIKPQGLVDFIPRFYEQDKQIEESTGSDNIVQDGQNIFKKLNYVKSNVTSEHHIENLKTFYHSLTSRKDAFMEFGDRFYLEERLDKLEQKKERLIEFVKH